MSETTTAFWSIVLAVARGEAFVSSYDRDRDGFDPPLGLGMVPMTMTMIRGIPQRRYHIRVTGNPTFLPETEARVLLVRYLMSHIESIPAAETGSLIPSRPVLTPMPESEMTPIPTAGETLEAVLQQVAREVLVRPEREPLYPVSPTVAEALGVPRALPPPLPPPEPDPEPSRDQDDTEIRYSMMELD